MVIADQVQASFRGHAHGGVSLCLDKGGPGIMRPLSPKPLPIPIRCFQANDPEYYQLDQSKTLGEALRGKVVLEFPRLLLAPAARVGAKYRLVETTAQGEQPPTA